MVALDFPDSPVDGQAFDMFVYDGTRQVWNIEGTRLYPTIEYLVIAGGGAGGHGYQTNNDWAGGGGGAGGYRSSVSGESSGGGASAETPLSVTVGASYTVTIGAGAAGQINTAAVEPPGGSNSVFGSIVSIGGGSGAGIRQFVEGGYPATVVCGSGGGAYRSTNTPGYGTANQGFDGGLGGSGIRSSGSSGGGGGAGEAGDTDGQGQGGDGVSSSITGSAVVRGGGGGGGATSIRLGGDGGGGNGSTGSSPVAGTVNTGGGGGGRFGLSSSVPGASGGSGIVILRYPSWMSLTVGAGLTSSTATVGSNKVTTFTAGSDDVTVGYA